MILHTIHCKLCNTVYTSCMYCAWPITLNLLVFKYHIIHLYYTQAVQSRDLQTVLHTCYSEYTILVIWTVKTKQSRAAASTYSWQKLKALLSNHEPISAREFYNQERAEVPHVPMTGSCKGPRQRGLSRLLPGGTAVLGVCIARIQNSANDAHGDMPNLTLVRVTAAACTQL